MAITPILSVPLEGPAIFVSHGGEAFPSLTMVLQGDGVEIILVGATYISKAGQAPRSQAEGQDQPAVHPHEGEQADDQRDSPDRLRH